MNTRRGKYDSIIRVADKRNNPHQLQYIKQKNYLKDDYRYSILKNQANTKESGLVYKLFITNVSQKHKIEQILDYFQNYGKVLGVHLYKDKNYEYGDQETGHRRKVGFIYFANSEVAAGVLLIKTHFINNHPVYVYAAQSCNQPYHALQAGKKSKPKQPSWKSKASIQVLNDDCLEYIFPKLNILDQINFSQTCRRFSDVFIMLSKVKYKMLQIERIRELTLWQKLQFLKRVGHNIESVKGMFPRTGCDSLIEYFGRYCVNIKSLNIKKTPMNLERMYTLIEKMHSCIELKLQNVHLHDESVEIIRFMPNLKILRLIDNQNLSGKHIRNFRNIEELSLEKSRNLQGHHFKNICQNLTNLHTLDVSKCKKLKGPEFRVMVQHLHKLEDLKMSSIRCQYAFIAQLPKLKRLKICEINFLYPLCHQLLIELAKRDSEQLEELQLMGDRCLNFESAFLVGELKKLKTLGCAKNRILDDNCLEIFAQLSDLEDIDLQSCIYITNHGLIELLQKCPKLNRINITCCKLITKKFVYDAYNLLKEQQKQTQRKVPVLLTAYDTSIFISHPESFSSLLTIELY